MKIKKIQMDGYVADFYKTKRYTTLHLTFTFQMEYTKYNIYLLDLLAEYLFRTNKIYKTRREINKQFRSLYDIEASIQSFNIGRGMFTEMSFEFFDPVLVQDNYLNNALLFIKNIIYDLNQTNGTLNKEDLAECRLRMISSMGSRISSLGFKEDTGYFKTIGENTFLTTDLIESKEEFENLLNSYTDKDIIKMHKRLLNESFVGAFLMGNWDDESLEKVKELFPFKKVIKVNSDYDEILDLHNVPKRSVIKDENIKESLLIATYTIDDYNPNKDKYAYNAIIMALNSVGLILHKILRNEMKIVYGASAGFNKRTGLFTIEAKINKDNCDKALAGFEISLERIKTSDDIQEIIQKCKRELKLSAYFESENKGRLQSRLIREKYEWSEPLKTYMAKFNKLNEADIKEAVGRLNLKNIYLYRGEK